MTEKNSCSRIDRNCEEQDVDAVIALLDGYTSAGESRIKVNVVEGEGEILSHQYHHQYFLTVVGQSLCSPRQQQTSNKKSKTE